MPLKSAISTLEPLFAARKLFIALVKLALNPLDSCVAPAEASTPKLLTYGVAPTSGTLVTKNRGDDPNELAHRYAKFINLVVAQKPAGMTLAMHLCRGNFRSTHAASGNYEPVAEALLQEMNIDAYFMEHDDDRSGDFKPLRYLPKGKTVVLGLVTTKFGAMENKDDLKRRIDEAARYAPIEQLALSPQCGFSSTMHGNDIAVEAQRAKLRLVIETAQEVWG